MTIQTCYSSAASAETAVHDISRQCKQKNTGVVLYFASSIFPPDKISRAMKDAFPDASVFGCTTAGELVSGKMLENSVVAMCIEKDMVDEIKIEVVENLKTAPDVKDAFQHFEEHFCQSMMTMDHEKYVGLILVDGLSGAEEVLMEKIGENTNVTFIGASAGDDLKFKCTYVYAEGKSYADSALLVLLRPSVRFEFLKTQSFRDFGKTLKATRVDESARTVIEFDGRPAITSYASAIGISVNEAQDHFMTHPLGLMVGDEPYVRSPQRVDGEHMVFYCNIKEGMNLRILESTDIVADTRSAIQKIARRENILGIVNFHCILRTLELKNKKQTEAYGKIFSDIPTIGFSTYGEEFIGHINQTSTMLLLVK